MIMMSAKNSSEKIEKMQAKDYFENITELLQNGEYLTVPVPGRSMEPFLYMDRDKVVIKKFDGNAKAGEIAIFKRNEYVYVLHRIYKVEDDNFFAIGDRERRIEGPIPKGNIVAIVDKAIYNGRELTDKSLRWKFYAHVWRRVIRPRRIMIAIVTRLHNIAGENK